MSISSCHNIHNYCIESNEENIQILNGNEENFKPTKSNLEKLLYACDEGLLDIVNSVIKNNKNLINCKDSDGYSPLHKACSNNHPLIVKILLKNEAHVNSITKDSWTPLHSAAHWNNFECISLLIDAGANINAQTNSGQTVVHLAAANSSARESLKILLMHKDLKPTLKNNLGESAKQVACRSGPYYYMFDSWELLIRPGDIK